jgi:hypothetical protein
LNLARTSLQALNIIFVIYTQEGGREGGREGEEKRGGEGGR